MTDAATHFKVSTKTVKQIWDRYLETTDCRGIGGDVSSQKGNSGRKKRPIDKLNAIVNVPLSKHGNLRSLSSAINIPKTILHRRLKEGAIKQYSSSVHQFLKEENKVEHVRFVL